MFEIRAVSELDRINFVESFFHILLDVMRDSPNKLSEISFNFTSMSVRADLAGEIRRYRPSQ